MLPKMNQMNWKIMKKRNQLKNQKLLVGVEKLTMTMEEQRHPHARDTVPIVEEGKMVGVPDYFLLIFFPCFVYDNI